MGDKYETGRQMLQQEINNLQLQLSDAKKQLAELNKVPVKSSEKAEKGALVETGNGLFYISVAAGEFSVNGKKMMAISPESPLAAAIRGKTSGAEFSLNGFSQQIINIQ